MQSSRFHHISFLAGLEVVRWVGVEEALSWEEHTSSTDSQGNEIRVCTAIKWEYESIPYSQFDAIDIHLVDGLILKLLSHIEDGTGYHGLYLWEVEEVKEVLQADIEQADPLRIFRTRELFELPIGIMLPSVIRQDEPNAVIEAKISIGKNTIRILSGEVREDVNSELRIVEADESILLQLNGMKLNQLYQ